MGKKFKQFQEEIQDSPYYDYVFNVLHPIEVVPDPNEDDENYDLTRGMSKDNSAIVKEDNNDVRMIYVDEFREYLGEIDDLFNNLAAMGLDSLVTSDTLPSWVGRLRTLRDEILTATPRVDDADYESVVSEEDLQELSKGTLASYVKKAVNDIPERDRIANSSIEMAKHQNNKYDVKFWADRAKKNLTKKVNRYEGIPRAVDKLAEEDLQELSKGTLASYVKKAVNDIPERERIANSSIEMAKHQNNKYDVKYWADRAKKNLTKKVNRYEGIPRAVDKLAEEDLQETSKEKAQRYINRAVPDHDMANFAKRQTSGTEQKYWARLERNRKKGISRAVATMDKKELSEGYSAGEMKLADGSSVTLSEKDASCLNRMSSGTKSKDSLDKTLKKNLKEFNALLDFAKSLKEDTQ